MDKCRCQHCKNAYATHRAECHYTGKDALCRPGSWNTDGHIPRRWFRDHMRHPAFTTSGLELKTKMHDLHHTHASWLLAGGADLQVVKERLGHAKISTTERYLHTLPTADETALNALNKIRVPRTTPTPDDNNPQLQAQLDTANEKITQLQALIAQQVLDQHLNNTPNLRLA